MSDERDEQGRPESPRYGQDPSTGSSRWSSPTDDGPTAGTPRDGQTADGRSASDQPSYDQPSYDQPGHGQPSYGQAPSGQSSYGQSSYGQSSYDQASYDQAPYGQAPYEQPSYGQPSYGQDASPYGQEASPYGHQAGYGQGSAPGGVQGYGYDQSATPEYGWGAAPPPARPGGVITAAVLGFVFGALGVLVSIGFFVFGAAATGASSGASSLDDELGLGSAFGSGLAAAAGIVFVLGLMSLAWTVLVIWGSVWALTGRSRVLLLVAGSISIAVTGLIFITSLTGAGQEGFAAGLVFSLLFFAGAIAIVVLVSVKQASQFFAAHRARRTAVG